MRNILHDLEVKFIVALAFYLVMPLDWTSITTHSDLAGRINAGMGNFVVVKEFCDDYILVFNLSIVFEVFLR
jgi:hypothetical protein